MGQARKSLWIETAQAKVHIEGYLGQARKSLWIETSQTVRWGLKPSEVRLVRACGSKQLNYYFWIRRDYGQARKSLWIETAPPVAPT